MKEIKKSLHTINAARATRSRRSKWVLEMEVDSGSRGNSISNYQNSLILPEIPRLSVPRLITATEQRHKPLSGLDRNFADRSIQEGIE